MEYNPFAEDFFRNIKDEDIFTLPSLDVEFGTQKGSLPTEQYNKLLDTFFKHKFLSGGLESI